jgi:spore maturation protein CgeB
LYNSVDIYLGIGNPLLVNGITQRIFECAAAGCFQIAEYKKDLSDAFGNKIVTFRTLPELKEKIIYYLANEKERKELAGTTREHVVSNFSGEIIGKELFEYICRD